MRTRAMNQIQAAAMNEGVQRKKTLWNKTGRRQLEALPLARWATRRRQDLLELVDRLNTTIDELTAAAEQEARKRPEVLRLMTHPGVGPITALTFVLVLGSPDRFGCGHHIGSYLGLIPCEDSSADRQRLGHITKQGSSLLRFLLVEAAQAAVRWDPDWRRRFVHLAMRRDRRIAKVAMARKLAVSGPKFRPKDYMRTLVGDDEFVQPKRNETAPRSECRPTLKNTLTQPRLLEMDEKPAIRKIDPNLPKSRAGSTGRCNTGLQFTRRRFKAQGLSRALIETQSYLVEIGLRVDGQVGLLREVLS